MGKELQRIHDATKVKEREVGGEAHRTIEKFIHDAIAQETARLAQQGRVGNTGKPSSGGT